MIQYILECIAFQIVFLIIYDLFLKRETFFQWNRVYLIGAYFLSMVLPWVKIEALRTRVPEVFQGYPEYWWNNNDVGVMAMGLEETTINLPWYYGLFFGGVVLATFLLIYKLFQIYALRKSGEVNYYEDFTQIIVSNSTLAFSFFKSIFLGDKILKKEHQGILDHELVHIRQKHSYDLMFFELMRIVGWFNPLVYVYQSRVSELHEFIADAKVAKTNKEEQYELLLSQVFQTQNISFINQFFKSSLIKKRIVMLQKTKSKNILQLKYVLLIPVILAMLAYSSSSLPTEANINSDNNSSTDDAQLINEISDRIQHQIIEAGSISNVYLSSPLPEKYKSGAIDIKSDFFEYKLIYRTYVSELLTITYPSLGENVPEEILKKYGNPPLPSSELYEAYRRSKNVTKPFAFTKTDGDVPLEIIPFAKVEEVPIFPGCEDADDARACFQQKMQRHISKNFNYPEKAQERGLQGRVNIMFTIGKDGLIENLQLRGPDKILENEAERIIVRLPKMLPGKHMGKVVGVTYSIPITFKLDTYEKDVPKAEGPISEVPFGIVDNAPVFPGCENEENKRACFNTMMQKHISKNFSYPIAAQEKGIQGRVNIMFTISKDGVIKNLQMRGPDELLEAEAKRIIMRLPDMKPGRHEGKTVDVPFSIPISFQLYPSNVEQSNRKEERLDLGFVLNNGEPTPLIMIDGKETSNAIVNTINPNDIESMYVLKGEAAQMVYGEKGKNGVISILTKKKD